MGRKLENWLLEACDPATHSTPPRTRLTAAEFSEALAAARRHFVLGSVLQSVAAWHIAENSEFASVIRPFHAAHLCDVGRTLVLRHFADRTLRTLGAAGIPCCVLKGEDFASRLYPTTTRRPYRDVDVLVPKSAILDADPLIQSLGFEPLAPPRKYAAEDYGQISYLSTTPERWSLELHWNVINSPAQRQTCSISWDDLEFEPQQLPSSDGKRTEVCRLAATSLLIVAGVHACLGHRFDSLQQLCDIRQICRGATGSVAPERLAEACRRLRCETPLAWSLEIVAQTFHCAAARDLLAYSKIASGAVRSWGMLGRRTVLRPQAHTSKFRRSLARLRLKSAA